jgi:hypothetical protein
MEKLIKDKWYRITNGTSLVIGGRLWYGKFLKVDGYIITSNHYSEISGFESREGSFGSKGIYTFTEVPLSEIQFFLPVNHPDKIVEIEIKDDLTALTNLLNNII